MLHDPDRALAEYDLTPAERAAVHARDAAQLIALGAGAELARWWGAVTGNGSSSA